MILITSVKYLPVKYKTDRNVRLFSNLFNRGSGNESKQNIIIKKLNEFNEWYTKIIGLDEVKMLQNKVIVTQDKLEKAQEERREVGKQLVDVRKRATELQEQLQKVQRWQNPELFLDITRKETFIMKSEKELTVKFEILDKTEREIFTALSNAVRDSHEKEKTQSEYTKYWSIILSIVGTLIGALLSMIISTMRNRQLVDGINTGVAKKFTEIKDIMLKEKQASDSRITQLLNGILKNTQLILSMLSETNKQIGSILTSIKSLCSWSFGKLPGKDTFVSIGTFMTAQKQRFTRQKEVKLEEDTNKNEGYGMLSKISYAGGAVVRFVCMLFYR